MTHDWLTTRTVAQAAAVALVGIGLTGLPALAEPADPAATPLLADDFENGISDGWLEVSDGVEVVAIQAESGTNHVLRMTRPGMELHSPPVTAAMARNGEVAAQDYEPWDDYRLSFRFRIVGLEYDVSVNRNTSLLLRLDWRIRPAADNPNERATARFQTLRGGGWRMDSPMIIWYGTGESFETIHLKHQRNIFHAPPAEGAWHTMVVTCRGDRTTIVADDQLIFDGADVRVLKGGFSITSGGNDLIRYEAMEIDDVLVTPVDPTAPMETADAP